MVDDGTACEIGMFAELVRSGGDQYRGIVGISTDIRLERRRQVNVVGGGMNLFVGGAIGPVMPALAQTPCAHHSHDPSAPGHHHDHQSSGCRVQRLLPTH